MYALQHAEVQKHASQILQKMLQQEEADLQVHARTDTLTHSLTHSLTHTHICLCFMETKSIHPSCTSKLYLQSTANARFISDIKPDQSAGPDGEALPEPLAVIGGED